MISGDVTPERALAVAREHFGAIEQGTAYAEVDCFRPKIVAVSGERRLSLAWDDQGKRLCIAWPGTSVGTEDDDALDVIAALLSGGRLSRLYKRLVVDTGLATSINVSNDARVEGGLFWIFAECAAAAKPEALERAIDEELALLAKQRVGAKELARVIAMLEASEAYDEETVSDLAEMVGEYAVDAHWTLAFEAIERVKLVTPARIQECARRLLARDSRVVGWCLPKPGKKAGGARLPAKSKAR